MPSQQDSVSQLAENMFSHETNNNNIIMLAAIISLLLIILFVLLLHVYTKCFLTHSNSLSIPRHRQPPANVNLSFTLSNNILTNISNIKPPPATPYHLLQPPSVSVTPSTSTLNTHCFSPFVHPLTPNLHRSITPSSSPFNYRHLPPNSFHDPPSL
ncbi:unnamed protein product [Vicia faba]|uniref:Uncharacterized protein n=1 Tax=Vicia faba TaxID=3906 RepID=A0AAV1ASV6_VICFA|nr:unnamed protein product [Vicia faba]